MTGFEKLCEEFKALSEKLKNKTLGSAAQRRAWRKRKNAIKPVVENITRKYKTTIA